MKYTPDVVELIHPKSFKWGRNASHMMLSIRWWGQQMQALNIIQQQPNYEQYFVTQYIEGALRDLRRESGPDYERALATPLW